MTSHRGGTIAANTEPVEGYAIHMNDGDLTLLRCTECGWWVHPKTRRHLPRWWTPTTKETR